MAKKLARLRSQKPAKPAKDEVIEEAATGPAHYSSEETKTEEVDSKSKKLQIQPQKVSAMWQSQVAAGVVPIAEARKRTKTRCA